MKAIRLQTEYMTEPLGLGNPAPRFFWNCDAERSGASPLEGEGGEQQSAYRIVVRRRDGELLWDTGKTSSARMTHIPYEGKELKSRDIADWQVTLWDETDTPGETAESTFEMGLLSTADWRARWISGDYKPDPKKRYPVDCFRREFSIEENGAKKKLLRVRLYATARGIYDVAIDGESVEGFTFAPGMTDYRKRLQVQTWDVTKYLVRERSGEASEAGTAETARGGTGKPQRRHTIELRLADGWFRGSVAAYGVTNVFGTQTSVLAQLELTYSDGSVQTVATDASWQWSNDGPIRFADLKDGEIFDARMAPSYTGQAREAKPPKGDVRLCPSDNVGVTEHEVFIPTLLTAPDGTRVLDFGQNIAGILTFSIKGRPGQQVKLTCGEVLDAEGHVDLRGIRETIPADGWTQLRLISKLMGKQVKGAQTVTPKQEVVFYCSGERDFYKMRFAVFGFRYAQIETEGALVVDPADFSSSAVYSDLEQTGDFTCSHEGINRLVENTRWSMKGNFLDVPTDCPTRERLGWTGDAQIFFNTGAYLMNTAPFFQKWLWDMEDNQYPNGLISAVIPYSGVEMMYRATGGSVGWADAVYLVPERFARMFGDETVLRDCYPMIRKYANYLLAHLGPKDRKFAKDDPNRKYLYEKGVHLGEWLEPEEFRDAVYGAGARHPEEGTAYLYLAMTAIADIAEQNGDAVYADKLRETAEGARQVYIAQFINSAAVRTDRQAKLVRPLALGLLDDATYVDEKKRVQKQLLAAVERYRYRVGTGFLSTPFLLPVLAEAGGVEATYRVLENPERPGWLSEVADGATTVWENWEGNFSQNHYSPGAVCEWLFAGVAGIRIVGERQFVIAPMPGGTLTRASATWRSVYGEVRSAWERADGKVIYTVTIPPNTTAKLQLLNGDRHALRVGENRIEARSEARSEVSE